MSVSQLPDTSLLPQLDLEHVRLRKTGWVPVWVAAGVGFAFVLGLGDRADPMAARVVLALASAAMASAVVLFGQVVLALSGRRHFHFLQSMPSHQALEEEKRQVLTAIKELEFDRAMNKINEADYQELRGRYESEALRVLKAIDVERTQWESRAQQVANQYLRRVGLDEADDAPPPPKPAAPKPAATKKKAAKPPPARKAPAPGPLVCTGCEVANDPDARFCKGCGLRLYPEEASS